MKLESIPKVRNVVSILNQDPHDSNSGFTAQQATYVDSLTKYFDLLYTPGGVIELRAPKTQDGVKFGFFQDHRILATVALSMSSSAPGIYSSVNCVNESLLTRSNHHVRVQMGPTGVCRDEDIERLIGILIDIDAIRPTDVSSTGEELAAALARTTLVKGYLKERYSWPDPLEINSGNGGQLRYIIELPNTPEIVQSIHKTLVALSKEFSDKAVKIDTVTFNPSRVAKIPWTMACKGESTPERPWRLSSVISTPPSRQLVTLEQIDAVWEDAEAQRKRSEASRAKPAGANGANGKTNGSPPSAAQAFGTLEKFLARDEKLRKLWAGDTSGHKSPSEADASLCAKLIFYFGPDASLVDSLFRQSGLMRDKWDEPRGLASTYGWETIADALSKQDKFYDPITWKQEQEEKRQQESQAKTTASSGPVAFTWRDVPCVFDLEAHVDWLVEGLVPERAITLFTGDSGHGKTILATALAGHIITGQPFLGHAVSRRKVLYMDRENPLGVVKQHLFDLHIERTEDLIVWGGWCDQPPDSPAAPSLMEFAREGGVIIFDSLIAFATGDEQSASDTRKYLQLYRQLAQAGATVIVLHHTGKSEGAKQYRGSSDIKASVDVAWLLEKLGDPAGLLKDMRLIGFKNRMGGSLSIPLSFEGGMFRCATERAESQFEIIERIVRTNPGETQRTLIEFGKANGVSKQIVIDLLAKGVADGRFEVRMINPKKFGYYAKEPDLGL
jgi:AAA domain